MKVVIVGGFGFVGQNIHKVLSESSIISQVSCLSRENGFDLLSLESDNINKKLLLNVDFIINCAADVGSLNYVSIRAADVINHNSRMILNLYDYLNKIDSKAVVINPIANCGYPGNLNIYREDNFWKGEIHESVLSYGMSRRLLTVVAKLYNKQYGMKSINYYVPNMYGEFGSTDPNKAHALNALISKTITATINNEPEIHVWGTGKPIREWLYAKDFGIIILETMIRYNDGEEFAESINIGQNCGVSINDLISRIVLYADYQGRIVHNTRMADGAMKKIMDNNKFRKRFQNFKFTDLDYGIQRTVNYYKGVLMKKGVKE